MSRKGWLCFAITGACLSGSIPAVAQTSSGTLHGTVTDTQRGPLAGATVRVVSASTGLQREAVTNAAGLYVLNFLPSSRYVLTTDFAGFKPVRQELTVEVGQVHTRDFRLELGGREEVVEVVESAPPLDRSSPTLGTVIQASQLKELPLNGRHWASLMMLAPGAINTGEGNHLTIRFAGRARDDNNWTFDGVDATGVKDPRQESGIRLIISMDAIAEFRVSSALYSAESGSGAGGQVQLVSRAGTNRFRGSVFEYFRDEMFDARSFADTAGLPPFRLHQFGANVGGPIVKDKTFFFVNYEGLRQRQGQTFTSFVPSAAFRAAGAAASPALAPIFAAYPAGTRGTSDPNVDERVAERRTESDENSLMVRLDHRFSPRTSVFARYSVNDAVVKTPRDAGTGLRTSNVRTSNLTVQVQRIFSSSVINELRLGMNKSPLDRLDSGYFDDQFTVPGFMTITGSQRLVEDGTSFSLVDDLAIVKGRHNIKLGGEVRRIHVDVSEGRTTSFAYASRPDFLANRMNTFSSIDDPLLNGRRWYFFGYVQDDFKPRPNLTLNLGLRYELYSVAKEAEGRAKVFALDCGGFCPPGTPFYEPDWNNFGPRLGFAWAPRIFEDKTVIRGGFGIFFGPGQNDDVHAPIDSFGERFSLARADVPTLRYPIDPFLPLARSAGLAPRALDRRRRDLYSESYGLSVQQELPWRSVLQVGYVGNQGHHLFSRSFVNLIDPATGQRPLSQFSRVDMKANDGNSNFHGLQVSLHRQMVNGFLLGAQYMWSHAINDASVGGGEASEPQNVNDRRADRGNSAQDVRHTATVNWIYELPFGAGRRYLNQGGLADLVLGGWQLSGLLQARTGRALTVQLTRSSLDLPDGNTTNQRPNRVPGVPLAPPGAPSATQWINPAAFVVPARGTWGDAGRGIIAGPGLVQLDLALGKRFGIGSERSAELRWEVFNVLNRDQLGDPQTNLSAGPSFGLITAPLNRTFGTGTARQMQFMLRVNF